MNAKTFAKYLRILVVLGLLSACGGGGGGSAPASGTSSSSWDTLKWDQDSWG